MELKHFIARLSSNVAVIRGFVEGVTGEQARWKPTPEEWSIVEVINHLYDEEREDFRTRLDLTLHHPGQPLPDINPQGWVLERQYNRRPLQESWGDFLQERQRSISWLKGLSSPAWEAQYVHPRWGPISAGTFMASWVAHDFLHIRQLAGLHRAYVALLAEPHSVDYAGSW